MRMPADYLDRFDEEPGVEVTLTYGGGPATPLAWDPVWRLGFSAMRRLGRRYSEQVDHFGLHVVVGGIALDRVPDGCFGLRLARARRSCDVKLGLPLHRTLAMPVELIEARLANLLCQGLDLIVDRLIRARIEIDSAQLLRDRLACVRLYLSGVNLGWDAPPIPSGIVASAGGGAFVPAPETGCGN